MKQEIKMIIMKEAQKIAHESLNEEFFVYENKVVKISEPIGATGKRIISFKTAKKEDANFTKLGYITDDCLYLI